MSISGRKCAFGTLQSEKQLWGRTSRKEQFEARTEGSKQEPPQHCGTLAAAQDYPAEALCSHHLPPTVLVLRGKNKKEQVPITTHTCPLLGSGCPCSATKICTSPVQGSDNQLGSSYLCLFYLGLGHLAFIDGTMCLTSGKGWAQQGGLLGLQMTGSSSWIFTQTLTSHAPPA